MSHDIDEYYAVHRNKRVRARKPHACDACGDVIAAGHLYNRVFWVFDGRAETIARCLRCEAIHAHLRVKCGWDMYPAERLDCGESYEDHWGDPPPAEIAALAFVGGKDLQPSPASGKERDGEG